MAFKQTRNKKPFPVKRKDGTLFINRMDEPYCVKVFSEALLKGINQGFRQFRIICNNAPVYPNACTPIAGIIDYYSKMEGIIFDIDTSKNKYLEECHFANPLKVDPDIIIDEEHPFDKLFYFNKSEQVDAITQAFVDYLSKQCECAKGVLDHGLNWCLNEVLANILLHGEVDYGFVMAQFHKGDNRVVFCVYDNGIGIYNSLSQSDIHKPQDCLDAITSAIQEGIGDGKGQGNGLFGLHQMIISENGGTLRITSGNASIRLDSKSNMKKYSDMPVLSNKRQSTTIDYQLVLDNEIDIQRALNKSGDFGLIDLRIDSMYQEDGMIRYTIIDHATGTATRESGELLRNDVLNVITRENTPVILDFSGISYVSSSFIDELIPKLFIRLGAIQFNTIIRIENMNDTIRFLCEHSLYMRIHDEWERRRLSENEKRG